MESMIETMIILQMSSLSTDYAMSYVIILADSESTLDSGNYHEQKGIYGESSCR